MVVVSCDGFKLVVKSFQVQLSEDYIAFSITEWITVCFEALFSNSNCGLHRQQQLTICSQCLENHKIVLLTSKHFAQFMFDKLIKFLSVSFTNQYLRVTLKPLLPRSNPSKENFTPEK